MKPTLTLLTALLLFFLAQLHAAELLRAAETGPEGHELLRDPAFRKGLTQGYANTLPANERAECLARWKAKGINEAQWAFWEISEKLYFAHNPATPVVSRPGEFEWRTADGAKQCVISNGVVHLTFDTRREWREGGCLRLPEKDGSPPKYGHAKTTWPHFLIGQHFAKDNDPATPIPDAEKLRFDRYQRLRFTADVKLNRVLKNSSWDHRADFNAPNHAIFYIAFVIMPAAAQRVAETGKIYVLVPAIYSEGQNRHIPEAHPWLGLDQFGDSVYFSGSQPPLRAGTWVHYDMDVKQLIREALAAATREARVRGLARTYRPEDHFIALMLIGWEVWGGFDTDVEFKNLSLLGWPDPGRPIPDPKTKMNNP